MLYLLTEFKVLWRDITSLDHHDIIYVKTVAGNANFFTQPNLPFSFSKRSQIFSWCIAVQLKDDISYSHEQFTESDVGVFAIEVWEYCAAFLGEVSLLSVYVFILPHLLPAWNIDEMAGEPVTFLDHEYQAHTLEIIRADSQKEIEFLKNLGHLATATPNCLEFVKSLCKRKQLTIICSWT